jgi:hypothetical protein
VALKVLFVKLVNKEKSMKGSIRLIVGLLIVFGAVGGLETSTNLVASVILAVAGLGLMYSGTKAMNENSL